MKHYSECHKWYCGINVYMKSGASELEFQRTCHGACGMDSSTIR